MPRPQAVTVPPPERVIPPVTDYRIDALRWTAHAPINPLREHHEPAGDLNDDFRVPPAQPANLIPLVTVQDLRPASAHTVSWERHDENDNLRDKLAYARPATQPELNLSQPGGMLGEVTYRNIYRHQPGLVRDQAPYTVGGAE